MKKESLIILLVAIGLIAWVNKKKTKAGPLILSLDQGDYGPAATTDLQPIDEDTKTLFDI